MMKYTAVRGLVTTATLLGILTAAPLSADTIVKMDLGGTSPDVIYDLSGGTGVLSTQPDGLLTSLGDKQTNAIFLNFVSDAGVANIPSDASITIAGIEATGNAVVFGGTLVNQETSGGLFHLYDQFNTLILAGELQDGVITGPLGTDDGPGPSTGSLFTVNLGKFVLPDGADDTIYKLLDPASAQLAMSFTNVSSSDGVLAGLNVVDGVLQDFTANVTAQIEAAARDPDLAPEPTSFGMALLGLLVVLGGRRRF